MTDPAPTCRPAPGPDLRQCVIASAIHAAWDRLNLAEVCRPRLTDLEPHQIEILLAALRYLIAQRCAARAVESVSAEDELERSRR